MKYFTFFLYLFVVTFTVYASPASAQGNTARKDDSFLKYLVDNTDYNTALNERITQIFKLSFPNCDAVQDTRRATPQILLKPYFAKRMTSPANNVDVKTTHPGSGQWIDKMIVRGCGQTTQLNFLVTAYSLIHLPVMYPTLNGQTAIQVMDQADAETAVRNELLSKKGCSDSIFVLGSVILGYKNPQLTTMSKTNLNSGWYERWVIEGCGGYHSVNLAILPDGEKRIRYEVQMVEDEQNSSPAPAETTR